MSTPITKLLEGCDAILFKPTGNSGQGYLARCRVDKVYEDVGMFEYRNVWSDGTVSSFPSSERIRDWQMVDFISRENRPLNILTEVRVAVIAVIHDCLARWGFKIP